MIYNCFNPWLACASRRPQLHAASLSRRLWPWWTPVWPHVIGEPQLSRYYYDLCGMTVAYKYNLISSHSCCHNLRHLFIRSLWWLTVRQAFLVPDVHSIRSTTTLLLEQTRSIIYSYNKHSFYLLFSHCTSTSFYTPKYDKLWNITVTLFNINDCQQRLWLF